MRITQVHSDDHGGGAEATARLHHEELLRRGFEARFLVAKKQREAEGVEQIEYVRGPKGLRRAAVLAEQLTGRQYLYSPSFRTLLRALAETTDVVHMHALHRGAEGYADVGNIAVFSRRVPLVMTVNDLWLLTGHCAYPLGCARWLSGCGECPDLHRYPAIPRDGTRANFRRKRDVFARARLHLIAPSQWVADQIALSPILGHLPTTIVYNPVDTSIFKPGDRVAARARLKLPMSQKIILVAAQDMDNVYKGIEEGISALNQIEEADVMLLVVGRGAERVLARCALPGVAVAYQNDQAGLVDCYLAADVFLMPSRCETFGMVAAEAMACGTPVVAFAAGGLTDVLGDDEGGLLVPAGDIDAMVTALRLLLNQTELRERVGMQAAVRSNREFSLQRHTDGCLAVYQGLLEGRNPGLPRFSPVQNGEARVTSSQYRGFVAITAKRSDVAPRSVESCVSAL